MPVLRRVWFATSNEDKFQEGCFILKEFGVSPLRLQSKGLELQSTDPSEVAAHAARLSYSAHRRPLFVEDTALFINHLEGFPGTYASFVFGTLGLGGILRLMAYVDNRDAEFVSAVAYCDSQSEPMVFVGRLRGRIARRRAGRGGFGFDPIFIPTETNKTLAQMTLQEKCEVSHRALAIWALGEWFCLNSGRQRLSAHNEGRASKPDIHGSHSLS